jgi:eukaryotic-like serine/threonine-protein kinase
VRSGGPDLIYNAKLPQKYADAEPLLKAGYEGMKQRSDKIPPVSKKRFVGAVDRLIELSEATNKLDDAKMWKDEKAKLSAPPPEVKLP